MRIENTESRKIPWGALNALAAQNSSMEFEWDWLKAAANREKHGVSFEEAVEVFSDVFSSTIEDPDHSFDEDRFVIFGRTASDRYVVVAFTDRDDRIRVISAREMTQRERRAYEQ